MAEPSETPEPAEKPPRPTAAGRRSDELSPAGETESGRSAAALRAPEPAGGSLRLTVFIGESDTWHHKPLFAEIVHRAHQAGLAGASVFRGVEGFGATARIHTARLLSLSEDLPVAIVMIDTEERIRSFLPELDGIVDQGLVVLDRVEVVTYRRRDR